jgi:hypothetical protein
MRIIHAYELTEREGEKVMYTPHTRSIRVSVGIVSWEGGWACG